MSDKACGGLLIGTNETGEVVINLDETVRLDASGIVLNYKQARTLARVLFRKAGEAQGKFLRLQGEELYRSFQEGEAKQ